MFTLLQVIRRGRKPAAPAATTAVIPTTPTLSPWVRRALASDLPAKELGR